MIRLVFLGKLADVAGGDTLELPAACDWAGLLAALPAALAEAVAASSTKVAVNGALVADKSGIVARHGDEIAFLPPVSGG